MENSKSVLKSEHRFKAVFSQNSSHRSKANQRDGVMVRAYATQLVDVINLGFIPQVESYQKTSKNGIDSFPAWCSAHRNRVKNKPASLFVVFLGKALDLFPTEYSSHVQICFIFFYVCL